tara:strand:- start:216 stop:812 length:597 start_codon:yes stop_codon:yes gene_type:complete
MNTQISTTPKKSYFTRARNSLTPQKGGFLNRRKSNVKSAYSSLKKSSVSLYTKLGISKNSIAKLKLTPQQEAIIGKLGVSLGLAPRAVLALLVSTGKVVVGVTGGVVMTVGAAGAGLSGMNLRGTPNISGGLSKASNMITQHDNFKKTKLKRKIGFIEQNIRALQQMNKKNNLNNKKRELNNLIKEYENLKTKGYLPN